MRSPYDAVTVAHGLPSMSDMIYRIALKIEYQGTAYCGWQYQPHCDSVQGQLQRALTQIANEPIELACAGRTDTGVHAIGQVAHFDTQAVRPLKAWIQGVNTQLPKDIRVVWAQQMAALTPEQWQMEQAKSVKESALFHARFSAVARQYRYVIYNRAVPSAVLADRVTWEPMPLDEQAMHRAAQALIGENDFSSFRAAACQAEHARREVQAIGVQRQGDFVLIDIQANAFLHHMVRNIAGTLLQVGRGEKAESWVAALLALQDRTQAGMTAPASGLYFVNALYPQHWGIPRTPLSEVLWQCHS